MKKFLFIVIGLFIVIPLVQSLVTTDTFGIDVTWEKGQTQPSNIIITFNNTENTTEAVNLIKEGEVSGFISINPTSFTLSPFSSQEVTLSWSIPTTVTSKIYRGNISYGSGTIIVILEVTGGTDCKLIPIPSSIPVDLRKDGEIKTERIEIKIGSGCVNGVDLSRLVLDGKGVAKEGTQSLEIEGNPGDTAWFEVIFDPTGVQAGVYNPSAKVWGSYDNEAIYTPDISFIVTVKSGEVSPDVNVTTLPIWEFPSSAVVGETFTIVARNVDPNLEPLILPNEDIYGEGVDIIGNIWNFRMRSDKTGTLTLKYTTLYRGLQIGNFNEKKISVTGSGSVQSSDNMTFDFFPSLSELRDGMTMNILVRDAGNRNIIPADIYVNGQKISNNTLMVEAGETYFLSATNPNYNTLDENFTVPKSKLVIVVIDSDGDGILEIGELITIVVKDDRSNTEIDTAQVFLNGIETPSTFRLQKSGNHTIKAIAENYDSVEKSITVEEGFMLLSSTSMDEISLGENITLIFNKEVGYTVYFSENSDERGEILISGNSKTIDFIPEEPGYYTIFANGNKIKIYELENTGLFNIPNLSGYLKYGVALLVTVIILVGGYLGWKKLAKRTRGRGGYPTPDVLESLG